MTEQQKITIRNLREQNFSYIAIARAMSLTVSTVKSYCQRNGLAGNRKESFKYQADNLKALPTFCRCCGSQIFQKEKVKRRIFCSDECRVTWWNSLRNWLSTVILAQENVYAVARNSPGTVQSRRSSATTSATSDTGMKE